MTLTIIKARLDGACVTHVAPDGPEPTGSLTMDAELLGAAGIEQGEQLQVLDEDSRERFEATAAAAPRGSREVRAEGAAARHVEVGHVLTVLAFRQADEDELAAEEPRVVYVSADNRVAQVNVAVKRLMR